MFLLKLLDQCLQELLLSLHLLDFGLHLDCDPLLHSPLVHFIAANLRKKLHMTHSSEHETTRIEFVTELG